MFDILIRGGQVADGSGAEPRPADVGIRGDRIADLGELSRAEAALTLDARGKLVCPGFIDAHSHSDAYLLIEPSAPSKISQGVTTEVVGNCGASAAPRLGGYGLPSDWRELPYPGPWRTVAEYRRRLEQARPAPNVALLIGHNALRAGIVGYENRPATAAELREMRRWLERSLEEGGCGLSTGLIYAPGMFAPREEIETLAAVVAARGGVYASHMRSEREGLLDALDETLAVGRATGVKVQISHLKTGGRAVWGRLDEAFARIERAQAEGVDAAADRYPYTRSGTDLDVILPAWAAEGGRAAILDRLRDDATRRRLLDELEERRGPEDWAAIVVATTHHPDTRRFRGLALTEAARQLGCSPAEAALTILTLDELRTSAFFCGMCEENMRRILARPYVMLGSDAALRALSGPLSRDYPHPRAFGTFPAFLRLVLDERLVPLGEAVRKMTSLPAARFGLRDRGLLARGRKADVLVIAPARVRAAADYACPHRLAEGIEEVIVNGERTWSGGQPTGARAGRFLETLKAPQCR